jgi:hypothetical protein
MWTVPLTWLLLCVPAVPTPSSMGSCLPLVIKVSMLSGSWQLLRRWGRVEANCLIASQCADAAGIPATAHSLHCTLVATNSRTWHTGCMLLPVFLCKLHILMLTLLGLFGWRCAVQLQRLCHSSPSCSHHRKEHLASQRCSSSRHHSRRRHSSSSRNCSTSSQSAREGMRTGVRRHRTSCSSSKR